MEVKLYTIGVGSVYTAGLRTVDVLATSYDEAVAVWRNRMKLEGGYPGGEVPEPREIRCAGPLLADRPPLLISGSARAALLESAIFDAEVAP